MPALRMLLLLVAACIAIIFSAHIFNALMFQGHIEQWIDFSSLEIDANLIKWYSPRIGRAPYLPPVSCVQRIFYVNLHLKLSGSL